MSRRPAAAKMSTAELPEPYIGVTIATKHARTLCYRSYAHHRRNRHGQPKQLLNL